MRIKENGMIYQKRGGWFYRDAAGRAHKFKSEIEALAASGITKGPDPFSQDELDEVSANEAALTWSMESARQDAVLDLEARVEEEMQAKLEEESMEGLSGMTDPSMFNG